MLARSFSPPVPRCQATQVYGEANKVRLQGSDESCLYKARHHAIRYQIVKHRLQQICNPALQPSLVHPPHLQSRAQFAWLLNTAMWDHEAI